MTVYYKIHNRQSSCARPCLMSSWVWVDLYKPPFSLFGDCRWSVVVTILTPCHVSVQTVLVTVSGCFVLHYRLLSYLYQPLCEKTMQPEALESRQEVWDFGNAGRPSGKVTPNVVYLCFPNSESSSSVKTPGLLTSRQFSIDSCLQCDWKCFCPVLKCFCSWEYRVVFHLK